MIAQQTKFLRQLFIVRNDRAGLAVRAEVLARIKTETAGIAARSDSRRFVFSAVRLRGIFNHAQVMTLRDVEDWIEVDSLAVKMHRNDRARVRSDGSFYLRRADRVRNRIDIDEDRLRAERGNSFRRRKESKRRRDHFIARSD